MIATPHSGSVGFELDDHRPQVQPTPPTSPAAPVIATATPVTLRATTPPGPSRANLDQHCLNTLIALKIDRLDHRVVDTEQSLPYPVLRHTPFGLHVPGHSTSPET